MDGDFSSNFDKICRICLLESDVSINLFDRHVGEELLTLLLCFEIQQEEGLPGKICQVCLEQMLVVRDFRRKCETSNSALLKWLKKDITSKIDTNINFSDIEKPFTPEEGFISQLFDFGTGDAMMIGDGVTIKKVIASDCEPSDSSFYFQYNCDICEDSFPNFADLTDHIVNKHSSLYTCNLCKKQCQTSFELTKHQVCHNNNERNCPFCREMFVDQDALENHLYTHVESSTHHCTECACYFMTHLDLSQHIHNLHPKEIQMCDNLNNNNYTDEILSDFDFLTTEAKTPADISFDERIIEDASSNFNISSFSDDSKLNNFLGDLINENLAKLNAGDIDKEISCKGKAKSVVKNISMMKDIFRRSSTPIELTNALANSPNQQYNEKYMDFEKKRKTKPIVSKTPTTLNESLNSKAVSDEKTMNFEKKGKAGTLFSEKPKMFSPYDDLVVSSEKTADIEKQTIVSEKHKRPSPCHDLVVSKIPPISPTPEINITLQQNVTVHKRKKSCKPGRDLFQCHLCSFEYVKYPSYRQHMRIEHQFNVPIVPFSCANCGKTWRKRNLIIKHVKRCKSQRQKHKCQQCKREFWRFNSFTAHMNLHAAQLKKKRTNNILRIKKELLKEQVKPQKQLAKPKAIYTCDQCELVFNLKKLLRQHLGKYHMRVTRYICDVCKKEFNRKNSLCNHMKYIHGINHSESKSNIVCVQCGKTSSNKSNMAVHMRRHSGVKTCICKICGKGFARMTDLRVHNMSHTGERPFTCSSCNKTFTKSDKLTRHQRIHTGERPFTCNKCGQTFAFSAPYLGHIKREICLKRSAALDKGKDTLT